MKNRNHSDYSIFKPDLEKIEMGDGSTAFISPLHSKYKELKELERNRRNESEGTTEEPNGD